MPYELRSPDPSNISIALGRLHDRYFGETWYQKVTITTQDGEPALKVHVRMDRLSVGFSIPVEFMGFPVIFARTAPDE